MNSSRIPQGLHASDIPESHTYTHVIGIGYLPQTPKRSLFFSWLVIPYTTFPCPLRGRKGSGGDVSTCHCPWSAAEPRLGGQSRDHGDFPHGLRPPCITSPPSPRLSLLCWWWWRCCFASEGKPPSLPYKTWRWQSPSSTRSFLLE